MDPALLLELTARYCEPHRRYHALPHVAFLLDRGRELDLSEDQVLAIWFHDAVYDVPPDRNEERSAELAVARLTAAGLAAERVRLVERIVLDTKDHLPRCPESRAVVDLDLSSLALPRDAYEDNSRRIREEYSVVPEDEFRAGRLAFVEAYLARERLFWTPWGEALEERARENLLRDRELYGGGGR